MPIHTHMWKDKRKRERARLFIQKNVEALEFAHTADEWWSNDTTAKADEHKE